MPMTNLTLNMHLAVGFHFHLASYVTFHLYHMGHVNVQLQEKTINATWLVTGTST
uniref:Uncharacterized protein n=1 Tax=Oryza brachyantha TaxID=4533 RepID=J3MZL2_ORYBR